MNARDIKTIKKNDGQGEKNIPKDYREFSSVSSNNHHKKKMQVKQTLSFLPEDAYHCSGKINSKENEKGEKMERWTKREMEAVDGR